MVEPCTVHSCVPMMADHLYNTEVEPKQQDQDHAYVQHEPAQSPLKELAMAARFCRLGLVGEGQD